jgi:hypothetical protein
MTFSISTFTRVFKSERAAGIAVLRAIAAAWRAARAGTPAVPGVALTPSLLDSWYEVWKSAGGEFADPANEARIRAGLQVGIAAGAPGFIDNAALTKPTAIRIRPAPGYFISMWAPKKGVLLIGQTKVGQHKTLRTVKHGRMVHIKDTVSLTPVNKL